MKKIKQSFIKFFNKRLKLYKVDTIDILRLLIIGFLFGLFASTFSSKCHAAEVDLKYGLGFGMPNQNDISESKFIALEYQTDFLGPIFKQKTGIGAWFDSHPEFQRTNSGFVSYSLGLRIEPGSLYFENYFGLSLISSTDSMLSTTFEFTEEIGFGIQDDLGRFIGLEYRHFSNAGIQLPNKGRDFILINTGVRL